MTRFDKPLVGIPCDVVQNGLHPFQGTGEKYINAVAQGAGAIPLLIPAMGGGVDMKPINLDMDQLLTSLHGLFFTGNASNIAPEHYGAKLILPDSPQDKQRDITTLALLRRAINLKVPVFAVCRGFQELNVALGGTLHQAVHQVPGMLDHREDKSLDREGQYAPVHEVNLTPGGLLAGIAGTGTVCVNSVHGQGIDRLADNLVVEARAPDGLVEAARLDTDSFVLGVQWHPEWRFWEDKLSTGLFQAFGKAVKNAANFS